MAFSLKVLIGSPQLINVANIYAKLVHRYALPPMPNGI